MLLERFKELVDQSPPVSDFSDLEKGYSLLGMDGSKGYSRGDIHDQLYKNIRGLLSVPSEDDSSKISKKYFLKLISGFVHRYVLLEQDPTVYITVLKVIQDSCRDDHPYLPSLNAVDRWQQAISSCKGFNLSYPKLHTVRVVDLRDDYPREFDIAKSIKELIDKGCEIEFGDHHVSIIKGLENVLKELEGKIEAIGGLTLVRSIFQLLYKAGRYSSKFERYYVTRETSAISLDRNPQIPFGLLLNLAAKFPYENSKAKGSQIKGVLHLATLIVNGAYGVQPYSYLDFFLQSGETIIEFCLEVALWDSLFSIPQSKPSSSLEICKYLFSSVTVNFENTTGFRQDEFFLVFAELNKPLNDIHEPRILYLSALKKILPSISTKRIQVILEFLSHPSDVNSDYKLPSDYTSIDFGEKPLIQISSTKFVLLNRSWCSPNYFESLATVFRSNLKTKKRDLDRELGIPLELFIRSKLYEKGIHWSSGKYHVDGVDGESDFIIEGDNTIILVEFKKKVLTKKSKSGLDVDIILDLSDSFLAALWQAGRTEIILREKEYIVINSSEGRQVTINRNNRSIERVAVTQLEYGGFQDRNVIRQFLTALLTHSVITNSTNEIILKKFKKLESRRASWVDQYNKLCQLDPEYLNNPFFNCWFLSLPQLMEVIAVSEDTNGFCENLLSIKYVSFNTLDWYREFEAAAYLSSHRDSKT